MPALLSITLTVSCKKDNKQDIQSNRVVSAGGPSGPAGACGETTLTGVITQNTTLKSCMIYKLSGIVYVANNAVLTIEPGTLIKGIKSTTPGNQGGGLVITQGAQIIAEGTVTDPIVFTSYEATPASGDWAGVTIVGKAPTNYPAPVLPPGIGSAIVPGVTFGGAGNNIPNDNSGMLKYIRIEYAGYELSTDNSMSGLILAGVGRGTLLDYIEIYKSKGDAFSFLGGTVNASHLLAIDPLDELFVTTRGYTGTLNFALGVMDIGRADKSRSNGIESDNAPGGSPLLPNTHPVYNYFTIVGLPNQSAASITNGIPSGIGRYGHAAYLKNNTEFDINKSIFLGFNYGIVLSSTTPLTGPNTKTKYDNGISTLTNNFVHAYIAPYVEETATGLIPFIPMPGNIGYTTPAPNTDLLLANPYGSTRSISNFIPTPLSPAKTAGAFPTGNITWANGWTRL
ncbi:hypothetical protein CK934_07450 [Chitinophaga sp. MD30]|nr:hypothetical protein CK934_07450 [Chitinophaga sp. MD30]